MVKVKEKTLAAIGRWGVLLPAAIIVFVGGVGKFVDPEMWRDEFVAWGYPAWMSPATGVLEVGAAVAMVLPWTRFYGASLATVVMLAAAGTRVVHGEWSFLVAPLLAAALAATTAWWSRPGWVEAWLERRSAASEGDGA